jgi:DegV family protein with EDD domain
MRIVTDSAADLPQEEVETLGVLVAPLAIQFPEGCVNSNEITPDDFYNRLEKMVPHAPQTSQPAAGVFAEIYRRLVALEEEVLSIHISSGLSGTLESARIGASMVPGAVVNLVDSLTLSGGERFQVLAAARAIRAGWDISAILKRLKEIQLSSEVVYTLDTLSYLARGGRIGRVQALAGSLLNLKPVIRVDSEDGKYSTAGKARTIQRALEGVVESLLHKYSDKTALWAAVMHGQFEEQAQRLSEMLAAKLQVARLEVLRISPVLGVHTGPGVVGVAVVPFHLMDGIG